MEFLKTQEYIFLFPVIWNNNHFLVCIKQFSSFQDALIICLYSFIQNLKYTIWYYIIILQILRYWSSSELITYLQLSPGASSISFFWSSSLAQTIIRINSSSCFSLQTIDSINNQYKRLAHISRTVSYTSSHWRLRQDNL